MRKIFDQMEPLFPTKLNEYCSYFDISFFDLSLKCIFCKHYLNLVDLAYFYEKGLSLVWRNNICYACCDRCLKCSARYEANRHFQCTFNTATLHAVVEKPLEDIEIRCYYCLCILSLVEKCDLIARGRPTCLVRGYFRAPCKDCIRREIY